MEFRNVNFSYPTKKECLVLKGVSFKVEQNQVVALVGHSGSGKSSIISLIERFYKQDSGQILLNGMDISTLEPSWYKSQISIVSQEPVMKSGSIRENICYGMDVNKVTDSDIDHACKMANAYDFIKDTTIFPDGYDTLVGERGIKLSGGQKQRVAIARALIRKPKILLLDEATSALDAESEHLVQKALDNLIKQGGQTVIVIAHRLSTIRDAHKIVVMKTGEIVEMGSHQELIELNGAYRKLIDRQLQSNKKGATDSPSPNKKRELDSPDRNAESPDGKKEGKLTLKMENTELQTPQVNGATDLKPGLQESQMSASRHEDIGEEDPENDRNVPLVN
mmetsp:Transcript_12194/g.20549  ORF Transcript_12194/g.20549 Transcript_12194/m.20549 type:complete len:336 (+) Transcript_12194:1169-2176(+)